MITCWMFHCPSSWGSGERERIKKKHSTGVLGALGMIVLVLYAQEVCTYATDIINNDIMRYRAVTIEYQRKQAKAMQQYLRDQSLEATIEQAK